MKEKITIFCLLTGRDVVGLGGGSPPPPNPWVNRVQGEAKWVNEMKSLNKKIRSIIINFKSFNKIGTNSINNLSF